MTIRVVLVDDDPLVRTGLRMILQAAPTVEVVGEVSDGAEAVSAVQQHRPDVVLMDIRMPRVDGLTATAAVRQLPDPPSVIVLTTFDLDDYVFRALQAGAAGFLLKDTPPRDLIGGIEVVARGDAMLSPAITRTLISRFAADPREERQRAARRKLAGLTDRESEIFLEVGRGKSNAEIGRQLFLAEATVKTHVSRLLDKLGAGNRVQLAIVAHDAGLLD